MGKEEAVYRRGEQEQDRIMGKKKLQNIAYFFSYAKSIFNIHKHANVTRKQKRHRGEEGKQQEQVNRDRKGELGTVNKNKVQSHTRV